MYREGEESQEEENDNNNSNAAYDNAYDDDDGGGGGDDDVNINNSDANSRDYALKTGTNTVFPGDSGTVVQCHTSREMDLYFKLEGWDHALDNGVAISAAPFQ